MARLMASGWVDRFIADITIKRRTNQAGYPMVTEGDRLGTNKKVVVAAMARVWWWGNNRAMAKTMAAGQGRVKSGYIKKNEETRQTGRLNGERIRQVTRW